MSARFYCPDFHDGERFRLDPEESRHLSQVCRLKVGDTVELFDGHGRAIAAEVTQSRRNAVELVAAGPLRIEPHPAVVLTLAIAPPKGDRFDWLIEKATELGVTRCLPIQTKRSVVEPRSTKIDRLRRAVIEASKQSGRDRLMVLEEPRSWSESIGDFLGSLRLIAHPGGIACRDWPTISHGDEVTLAIGPEGGFTEEEVQAAAESGWIPVGLGPYVLRIETAGIAGCSAILAREVGRKTSQPVH